MVALWPWDSGGVDPSSNDSNSKDGNNVVRACEA